MPFSKSNPGDPHPCVVAVVCLPQQPEIAVSTFKETVARDLFQPGNCTFQRSAPENASLGFDDLSNKIHPPIDRLEDRLVRVEVHPKAR